MKQPNVSNHLARMRRRGTVQATKKGRYVYYSICAPLLLEALARRALFTPRADEPSDLNDLATQYAEAATRADDQACSNLIDCALSSNYTLLDIYEDLIGAAMRMIGTWWETGKIDVAQEHIATAVSYRQLERIAAIAPAPSSDAPVALLGAVAGTLHVLGLRMISDYLASIGWKSVYLGANVPTDSFAFAARTFKPSLVLISCGSPDSDRALPELVKTLRKVVPDAKLTMGGTRVTSAEQLLGAGADDVYPTLRSFADSISSTTEIRDQLT